LHRAQKKGRNEAALSFGSKHCIKQGFGIQLRLPITQVASAIGKCGGITANQFTGWHVYWVKLICARFTASEALDLIGAT
jgi:hypothetical protein